MELLNKINNARDVVSFDKFEYKINLNKLKN